MYCYMALIVIGYPLIMFCDSNAAFSSVQPLAFFGTYFTLLSLQMPYILFSRLYNPFDAHDDINAENLVASTELALFNSMRCQFREKSVESDFDGNNEFGSEISMCDTDLSNHSLSSASFDYSMDNERADSITSSKCVRCG